MYIIAKIAGKKRLTITIFDVILLTHKKQENIKTVQKYKYIMNVFTRLAVDTFMGVAS